MVVAAIVAWAFYSAMLRLKPPVHWTSFAVVTFAIAMLANIPLAIVEHIAGHGLQPTLMTAAAIVYAGIGSGVIGIAAWNIGVEMIGSQRAGGYLNLVPVFSVLLAAFVLGERLEMFHALAFALIAAGLWLAAFPARDGRAA